MRLTKAGLCHLQWYRDSLTQMTLLYSGHTTWLLYFAAEIGRHHSMDRSNVQVSPGLASRPGWNHSAINGANIAKLLDTDRYSSSFYIMTLSASLELQAKLSYIQNEYLLTTCSLAACSTMRIYMYAICRDLWIWSQWSLVIATPPYSNFCR